MPVIYVLLITWTISALLIPLAVWFLRCIQLTGQEKIAAYVAITHRPMTGPALYTAIQAVAFNQHLRARLLFRDPWALYDPMVLDAMRNPRTEVVGFGMMPGGPEEGPPAIH